MKLTSKDKELLITWGYRDKDLSQIQKATTRTVYEMNSEKISIDKTLEVLGRKTYLSGISRSAFHYSAVRNNDNGETVYFDSSRLFE